MNRKDYDYNKLAETIQKLEDGLRKFKRYKQDSDIDKLGFGFNKDNRFSSIKFTISVDSWVGAYGNSSCGTILGTLNEAFKDYFIEYLNQHKFEIFEGILELMKRDIKNKSQKQISELQEKIKYIKKTFLEEK